MVNLIIPPDLLLNWDIAPVRSVNLLPPNESAPAGNVAFVETESGNRYVLKRRAAQFTRPQEFQLLEALAAQGVPVAVPVQSRSGERHVRVGDDYYDLSPRLQGAVYSEHYAPGAEGRARQFGAAIARLHVALRGCGDIISMPDMDLPRDIRHCSSVVRSVWPLDKRPPESILSELETGLAGCFSMLPQQLIHRDAHPGNMLFHNNQFTGWIDFELLERGPRLFDLCYCSTSLLMDGLDDPDKRHAWPGLVRALVAGYDTVNPLTSVERAAVRMMQMAIEVIFIAWLASNNYPGPAAKNVEALVWLYENPYEL